MSADERRVNPVQSDSACIACTRGHGRPRCPWSRFGFLLLLSNSLSYCTPGNATPGCHNTTSRVCESLGTSRRYWPNARSLHHAGAIGAVSATRVLLPVVQRAPVDGRVDEVGAPLQQCASYAVRHHLGWQRERLQKIFPQPSIRIQVKASTCKSIQINSSQHKSSQVRSGQVKASTCQACFRRSSITSMPIDPIRRHQRQSDVIKGRTEEMPIDPIRRHQRQSDVIKGAYRGDPHRPNQTSSEAIRRHQGERTEEILDHVDAHPLAPTRGALDCAGMLDGGEPRP